MPHHTHTTTCRHVLFALDSQWQVKWKFLFDSMPEDYTGYIPIWDTIPWQTVTVNPSCDARCSSGKQDALRHNLKTDSAKHERMRFHENMEMRVK